MQEQIEEQAAREEHVALVPQSLKLKRAHEVNDQVASVIPRVCMVSRVLASSEGLSSVRY